MISLLILLLFFLLIGAGIWGWPLVAAALGLPGAMDKRGALVQIKQLMNRFDISPDEVDTVFREPVATPGALTGRAKGDVARRLFTYLGAIFIVAGLATYIGSFWESMGATLRVLVTLGVGYALFIVLVAALYEQRYPQLVLPLTLASVLMMTWGWLVLLDEVYPQNRNWRGATLFVCGVMTLHQGALFAVYRRTVQALTALSFAYGFMYVGLDILGLPAAYIAIVLGASVFLLGSGLHKTPHRALAEPALLVGACWLNSGLFDRIAIFISANWASLLVGANLMLAAYGLHRAQRHPRLTMLGYLIGSAMAYTALFDLLQNTAAELLYLAVTAFALYVCTVLESRALLFTTVVAMLGFIGYYSAEYFANSLGWPVALVLMGLAFLAVGAIALRVKRRM